MKRAQLKLKRMRMSLSKEDDDDAVPPANQGQLIIDASCAPADIRYPTDLSLLNEAREGTEIIIDVLYDQVRTVVQPKPRTYRKQARREYLNLFGYIPRPLGRNTDRGLPRGSYH